jgi:hypothetical protein
LASTAPNTTTTTTTSINPAASSLSKSSQHHVDTDVEMVDAMTDNVPEETPVRDTIKAQSGSNNNSKTKTPTSSSTPRTAPKKDGNGALTIIDAPTSKPAVPPFTARASADVDAAEMLLGLRAA